VALGGELEQSPRTRAFSTGESAGGADGLEHLQIAPGYLSDTALIWIAMNSRDPTIFHFTTHYLHITPSTGSRLIVAIRLFPFRLLLIFKQTPGRGPLLLLPSAVVLHTGIAKQPPRPAIPSSIPHRSLHPQQQWRPARSEPQQASMAATAIAICACRPWPRPVQDDANRFRHGRREPGRRAESQSSPDGEGPLAAARDGVRRRRLGARASEFRLQRCVRAGND
jgi:hypothetical protein